MKQTLGALFCGLALGAAAATPASAAPSCRIPGGRVVAAGVVARLIAVPTPLGSALYACIRHTGRKVPLDDGYTDARVAGRWAAWQRPEQSGRWRIVVHDLRTGKERLVIGRVAARSLKLTTRGSIAWAEQLQGSDSTPLFANEPGVGGRLLDNGDVDARSVRLEGRLLSWRADGVEYSSLLR